jgi:YD repeat-containing protein
MNACYRILSCCRAGISRFRAALPRGVLITGFLAIFLSAPAFAGTVTYTYDVLGRLITATYSTGAVITYSYDATGNRTSVVTTGAP